jgi:hypothetical protein
LTPSARVRAPRTRSTGGLNRGDHTEACLDNVLLLDTYRKAQEASRRGGEQGKQLLKSRLDS